MLSDESGSYNEHFKQKLKLIGKKAMKELAMLLELKEWDIHFNPGGIAFSGDLSLMGMWEEGNGVYVTMNKDFPGQAYGDFYFRSIKDMKDFTGGTNCWMRFALLRFPDAIRERIFTLRRWHENEKERFQLRA